VDDKTSINAALFSELRDLFINQSGTWKIKQNDFLDNRTAFIYKVDSREELKKIAGTSGLTKSEFIYAEHRWRNFKRHEAWLSLIVEFWPDSRLASDPRDKSKDFSIRIGGKWIDFDLKVTRYPRSVAANFDDLQLAIWMYVNQSNQQRFHLKNRVFVVGQPEASIYEYELAKKLVKQSGEHLTDKLIDVQIPNSKILPKAIILRV
jgi:hypothetical protein